MEKLVTVKLTKVTLEGDFCLRQKSNIWKVFYVVFEDNNIWMLGPCDLPGLPMGWQIKRQVSLLCLVDSACIYQNCVRDDFLLLLFFFLKGAWRRLGSCNRGWFFLTPVD